jgi:hypothetical protein
MIKWRLMLTTLPFVAVALAVKFGLDHAGYKGWIEFGDLGPLLTVGAFLIGFMLAGTMADYKESERMPGELACALETIEDTTAVAARAKKLDEKALLGKVWAVTESVTGWLSRKRPVADVYTALTGLGEVASSLEAAGSTPHAIRVTNEAHGLRKIVTRVEVISRTGFLQSGYALLEFMVLAIVVLLLTAHFKSRLSMYLLITFISFVYVYMLRLIKDIDDPFEYNGELKQSGSADVDPTPLVDYAARAKARL